jgi:hypothetical protein
VAAIDSARLKGVPQPGQLGCPLGKRGREDLPRRSDTTGLRSQSPRPPRNSSAPAGRRPQAQRNVSNLYVDPCAPASKGATRTAILGAPGKARWANVRAIERAEGLLRTRSRSDGGGNQFPRVKLALADKQLTSHDNPTEPFDTIVEIG